MRKRRHMRPSHLNCSLQFRFVECDSIGDIDRAKNSVKLVHGAQHLLGGRRLFELALKAGKARADLRVRPRPSSQHIHGWSRAPPARCRLGLLSPQAHSFIYEFAFTSLYVRNFFLSLLALLLVVGAPRIGLLLPPSPPDSEPRTTQQQQEARPAMGRPLTLIT